MRAKLVSPEDIAAILEPPRRRRGRKARSSWNDYDAKRSGRFSEALERRRDRGGEDDDPAEPAPRAKKRRKATIVGGFLLEDSEVSSAPAEALDPDEQTATIDSRAAAQAALRLLDREHARPAAPRSGLAARLKDRRLLAAAVVAIALGLALSSLFDGRSAPAPGPGPELGRAPETRDLGAERRLRAALERRRRARASEEDEDFAAARALWRELEDGEESVAALKRLDAILAFESRAAEALAAAPQRPTEQALTALGTLLNAEEARGSAAGRRLIERLSSLVEEAGRSGLFLNKSAPSNPAAAAPAVEPAARLRAFEALRREGAERVTRLSQAIEAEGRAAEARRARGWQRLARAFADQAMTLRLRGGGRVRDCRLTAADEAGVELEAAGGRERRSWFALAPEDAWRLRRAAAGPDPWDQWDLGRFALEIGWPREAAEAFRRAGAEPALRARAPELGRAPPPVPGRLLSYGGGLVSLGYGPEWPGLEAEEAFIEDGALSLKGEGLRRVVFGECLFEDGAAMRGRGLATSGGALLGLGLVDEAGAGLALAAQPSSRALVLLRLERGGSRRIGEARRLSSELNSLGLSLSGGRARGAVNGAVVFEEVLAGAGPWRPVVLALGSGSARLGSLDLSGRLVARGLGERLRARERSLAAWELGLDDRPLFLPRGRRRSGPVARGARLSAEDAYGLRDLGELEGRYRRACEDAASDDFGVVARGLAELRRLTGAVPSLAAGLYRRAVAHRRLGQRRRALVLLGRAAASCPRFYEAMSLRAELLAELGYRGAARREAERALSLRPDEARALRCLGEMEAAGGDLAAGRRWLELATALDPWDEASRRARRFVARRWRRPASWTSSALGGERFLVAGASADLATLAAVRRGVAELLALGPSSEPARLRFFADASALAAYGRPGFDEPSASAAAQFHPGLGELLLVEGAGGASLARAAARQRLWEAMPEAPSWLVAAVMERAASWRFAAGQIVGEAGVAERARRLRAGLDGRGGAWPWRSLMARAGGLDGAGRLQSWSVGRFLSSREAVAWSAYAAALRGGAAPRAAFSGVFGERAEELEAAWREAWSSW